jgi:hypothetical protein
VSLDMTAIIFQLPASGIKFIEVRFLFLPFSVPHANKRTVGEAGELFLVP